MHEACYETGTLQKEITVLASNLIFQSQGKSGNGVR